MEEKIFTKVDGKAYAEAGIACGELTPVVAVKFARVLARRGVVGEEVISYSQNGIVEKVATVSEDPETKETGWVLTKLDENGEVLVDGVNVKEYKKEALNNKIGYVPQKAVMFNGTVFENVGYGESLNEKTEDTLKEAIRVAQGEDFVLKMDDKYDSHIAPGGTNISGGQKQRLAIARAIARKPEIYIFDDSFSALDYKTDSVLRHELKKYTKDATCLIVAQRIGTIMNADKIIVLDNGTCVGMGTHKELLKKCSVYKEIALSQLGEEELENGK